MAVAGTLRRWRWVAAPDLDQAKVQRLANTLHVDPLVARLLMLRNIDEQAAETFLDPRLTGLHDPASLPGCDAAAKRIVKAVRDGQPVVVYGDYDVDGITAAAILWHTLKLAGATVETYVPHRIEEGYGLNVEALREFASREPRPLVVSVDCGITAVEPAKAAREAGLELIITDHHAMPAGGLPDASMIVHPRLHGAGNAHATGATDDAAGPYPFGDLCGAGVALKLAWQFAREWTGAERVSQAYRDLLLDLLSLAALGTIADVVPLVDENRIITSYGLGQIQRTRFEGVNALIEACRLTGERIDAFHVGFVLAPRLNACGRMGHAREALQLLTEATGREAQRLARYLSSENDKRRRTERDIFEQAKAQVIEQGFDQPGCRAIVVAAENWHPGVIGIVASRLVDAFHRPAVMLSVDNGCAQGSARSVEGFDLHAALQHAEHLMDSFGGHAMAAGMRLSSDRIDALRDILVEHANAHIDEAALSKTLHIDADCTLDDLQFGLFQQLHRLAPFGRANPAPILRAREVALDRPPQRVGGEGRHLKLWLRGGSRCVSAIAFGLGHHADELASGSRIDVAFEPKLGTWRGQPQIEVHVKDVRVG